ALRQSAHLARADDADEAGVLEHLHVVPDRAFRKPQLLGQLGDRARAVAELRDDPDAEVVGECAQTLAVRDDEHVVGLVVVLRTGEYSRMFHGIGIYGISRPLAIPR